MLWHTVYYSSIAGKCLSLIFKVKKIFFKNVIGQEKFRVGWVGLICKSLYYPQYDVSLPVTVKLITHVSNVTKDLCKHWENSLKVQTWSINGFGSLINSFHDNFL